MIAARALALGVALAATLGLACEASPVAGVAITAEDRGGNCATCHMPEYEGVRDPVHVGEKPTTCAVCHEQTTWRPSVLHHPFWALTGKHEKAPCSWCHKGTPMVFKGTSKVCVDCHRPDYDASTYPGHETFPTTCTDCHTTLAWRPATKVPPKPPEPVAVPAPTSKLAPATKGTPRPTATTHAPVVPTTPPHVPTATPTVRPPPDVTSRPSPRR